MSGINQLERRAVIESGSVFGSHSLGQDKLKSSREGQIKLDAEIARERGHQKAVQKAEAEYLAEQDKMLRILSRVVLGLRGQEFATFPTLAEFNYLAAWGFNKELLKKLKYPLSETLDRPTELNTEWYNLIPLPITNL